MAQIGEIGLRKSGLFTDTGRIGQKRFGGRFYEEFLPELQGDRGVQVYKEMSENDDIIGAILFAIENLIRQVDWNVLPMGAQSVDEECAEFIDSCMKDFTETTWTDTISEILTFLVYGWSAHEIVYKRRMGRHKDPRLSSKYDDGLIGWKGFPIRGQETLNEWLYDDQDNLIGIRQNPPPKYELIDIPIERLLLFKTKSRKGNPEGRSILRNAYRLWYFKKRIQEIEGIGIERDLAGLPVITAPEDTDIWLDTPDMIEMRGAVEKIVQNIRRDALEGVVLPAGWKLELLSTGGQRQFDTNSIIDRYDTRIAMTALADFVMLGHRNVGSFALSSDKTKLFSVAIGSYLDIICEVINNKAIPKLIELNAEKFGGITDYPVLSHGDVEDVDLAKLGEFIRTAVGSGAVIPDEELEDYLREAAHLPKRIDSGSANRKILHGQELNKPVKRESMTDFDGNTDEDIDGEQ